jgi:O-antigen/teichoic acid export membrane protein
LADRNRHEPLSTNNTSVDETTESESLTGRATRGATWAVLGFATSQVLRLGGNLILTRLLFEEAFGLMALVQVVQQGLGLFSDIGIGPSIVQNKRQDDAFLNTAFTLQAARGVVLTLVGVALGQPVAAFYGEPELAYLLPFVSLTAFIAGFNSTRVFTLSRELSLGRGAYGP